MKTPRRKSSARSAAKACAMRRASSSSSRASFRRYTISCLLRAISWRNPGIPQPAICGVNKIWPARTQHDAAWVLGDEAACYVSGDSFCPGGAPVRLISYILNEQNQIRIRRRRAGIRHLKSRVALDFRNQRRRQASEKVGFVPAFQLGLGRKVLPGGSRVQVIAQNADRPIQDRMAEIGAIRLHLTPIRIVQIDGKAEGFYPVPLVENVICPSGPFGGRNARSGGQHHRQAHHDIQPPGRITAETIKVGRRGQTPAAITSAHWELILRVEG